MTQKFDRLAPGLVAKINVLSDVVLLALCAFLICGVESSVIGTLTLVAAAVTAWIVATTVTRYYSPCTPRNGHDELALGVIGASAVVVAVALANHFLPASFSLPFDAVVFGIGCFAVTALPRQLVFRRVFSADEPLDDVLIVGTGSLGVETYNRMRASTGEKRRVVGFIRFENDPSLPTGIGAPVLGCVADLEAILLSHPVSEIYIAGRVLIVGMEMQRIASLCEAVGVPFAMPLHSLTYRRATLLSASTATDGYLHYLTASPRPVSHAVKRLLDIVCATIGLLILSPLLLGVAAAIKATSKGPVLFRQARVGLHGAHFNLLKFRSMVMDAESLKNQLMSQNEQSGPVFKMRHDPRVTRIGRFIRRYSIDELPQLVNILRGDMSIVGPRPAVPEEVAQYKPWQRRRFSVRPGLTCYWQVGGRNEIGFDDWMRLDLRYVDNWTLKIDCSLILKTVPVVMSGKGAS